MASFNLENYETVEERIKRFYADNPDGRILTLDYSTGKDRAVGVWRVRAEVFLTTGDQAAGLPKAVGHAFEVDGSAGASKLAALENAETSAIGRALANAGYSGNKRASREEMMKAKRAEGLPDDIQARIAGAKSIEDLRALYQRVVAVGRLGEFQSVIDEAKARLEK